MIRPLPLRGAPPLSEYEINDLEELRKTAEEFGCSLVEAKPNQLLLDLDRYVGTEEIEVDGLVLRWLNDHRKTLEIIHRNYHINGYEAWSSRNNRLHVLLELDTHLDTTEAIAFQAALGSDPVREATALWENAVGPGEDTRSLFRPKG